jgi:hypothetical protein
MDRIATNGVRSTIVESPDRFARDLAVQLLLADTETMEHEAEAWCIHRGQRRRAGVPKKNKTAEEIQDENERTNPMGLFTMAEAYRLSALALENAEVAAGHADSPIRFLYYHALELYLKALLRQKYSIDPIEGFTACDNAIETLAYNRVVARLNDGGQRAQPLVSFAKRGFDLSACSNIPIGFEHDAVTE